MGLSSNDRLVVVVAYDEEDLSMPVTVYADLDGKGLVTHVWSVSQAPSPCAIVAQLHHTP